MKVKLWKIFLMTTLFLLMLVAGLVIGYIKGYENGVTAVVGLLDKVHIDKFEMQLNQTAFDDILSNMQNLSNRLNNCYNKTALEGIGCWEE